MTPLQFPLQIPYMHLKYLNLNLDEIKALFPPFFFSNNLQSVFPPIMAQANRLHAMEIVFTPHSPGESTTQGMQPCLLPRRPPAPRSQHTGVVPAHTSHGV